MTGFETYQLYSALKLHFTSEYDYFKYRGKSRSTVESYEKNRFRYQYQKLSRVYLNKDSMTNFMVSNFIKHPQLYVLDLLTEEAKDTYLHYEKYWQALSYNFDNDCQTVFQNVSSPQEIMRTSGDYPILFKLTLQGNIHFQSLCIMNRIVNFIEYWDKTIEDDLNYPTHSRLIKKYSGFISEEDTRKCKQIFKGYLA